MALFALFTDKFSELNILSDSGLPSETRLEVFHQGVSLGAFYAASVGAKPADAFTKDLLFLNTLTSDGSKWVFNFTPTDINSTASKFSDGVWHFLLSAYPSSASQPVFGAINDEAVVCCIAQATQEGDTTCGLKKLEGVNQVHALLVAADANLRMSNPDSAVCLYNLAASTCDACKEC